MINISEGNAPAKEQQGIQYSRLQKDSEEAILFNANRPFMFLIVDDFRLLWGGSMGRGIIFMGRYVKP